MDLFEGQPSAGGAFEIRYESLTGLAFTEFGCGNQVVLSAEAILRNLQAVKQRNLVEANSKRAIRKALDELMVDGIKYEKRDGQEWEMLCFRPGSRCKPDGRV